MAINEYLPIIQTVGIVILAGSYLVIQWKTGANKASAEALTLSNDVITGYKEQILQLRTEHSKYNLQVIDLTAQLNQIKGEMKQKNDELGRLTAIFQNRDPESDDYRKFMLTFTNNVTSYMKDTASILGEVKIFMESLNHRVEDNTKHYQETDKLLKDIRNT